jgi:hypothetical protein
VSLSRGTICNHYHSRSPLQILQTLARLEWNNMRQWNERKLLDSVEEGPWEIEREREKENRKWRERDR